MAGEVVSGAAQGAAIGAAAGPVGAVVGGIVGAIGGLFASKANKNKRKATKEQRAMVEREAAVQRRDIVRQIRITQAQAIAASASESGGLESSAPQGAIGSIQSQGLFNLGFFGVQATSQTKINSYLNKAEKYAGYASLTGSLLKAGSSLAGYGIIGGGGKTPSGGPASNPQNYQSPSPGYSPSSILDYTYGGSQGTRNA